MVQGVLDAGLAAARHVRARRITAVRVVVGEASRVDDDAFLAHFAVHAAGTEAEGANVMIRHEPATALCWDCTVRFAVGIGADLVCPACGSSRVRMAPAGPPRVEAIEVDDEAEA